MSGLDTFNIPESVAWIKDRTILAGIVGSHSYGTNVETSDKDYKGVCIPPKDYYLGLRSFNDYNTTGGKNWKSTKDDVDISIMHINKFVMDCMKGVPNNLELLFLRPEDYIVMTPLGEELISKRQMFISKVIKHKFGGYAFSQIQLLKVKKSNGTGRQDLVDKYGYDTKFGAHAVRLITSAIEILKTGTFTTYRPNYEELVAIRHGKYTLEELLVIIGDLDRQLNELYETSTIPHSPDYNAINEWLTDFNGRALANKW